MKKVFLSLKKEEDGGRIKLRMVLWPTIRPYWLGEKVKGEKVKLVR
jgi:hypothetical protein